MGNESGSASKKDLQKKVSKEGYLATKGERVSYGSYFLGQNIFYMLLITFMTPYFTDIGIPAATVAVIALIIKVWDAVNDPIFGGIVDRVNFKKGKFLPWLRVSLIAIPLTTIFLFAIPSDVSLGAKVAWAIIGYVLWDTAYTICDVPIFGIVTTITDNVQERTGFIALGRVTGIMAALVVTVVVGSVREAIGGWLPTAIALSVAGLIFMVPICFTAKERIKPQTNVEEVGLKQMFSYIVKNKYLLIMYAAIFVGFSTNIAQGLMMYVARYNLGNEGLLTPLLLLLVGPMIIVGIFIPPIARKIDKFYIFFWSLAATGVIGIISWFVGYENMALFFIFAVLRGIAFGGIGVLMFMFTPDCVEYGLFKSGISASGVTFAVQTFTVKLTSAVATAIGAAAIAIAGFVEGANAVQPAGFNDKLWLIFILIPSIGALLALPILSKYKLRDKYVEIMTQSNTGKITHEEADALLAGKI